MATKGKDQNPNGITVTVGGSAFRGVSSPNPWDHYAQIDDITVDGTTFDTVYASLEYIVLTGLDETGEMRIYVITEQPHNSALKLDELEDLSAGTIKKIKDNAIAELTTTNKNPEELVKPFFSEVNATRNERGETVPGRGIGYAVRYAMMRQHYDEKEAHAAAHTNLPEKLTALLEEKDKHSSIKIRPKFDEEIGYHPPTPANN